MGQAQNKDLYYCSFKVSEERIREEGIEGVGSLSHPTFLSFPHHILLGENWKPMKWSFHGGVCGSHWTRFLKAFWTLHIPFSPTLFSHLTHTQLPSPSSAPTFLPLFRSISLCS